MSLLTYIYKQIINYIQFGFRKWKSHLTKRPLSERSDKVKALYADSENIKQKSLLELKLLRS